MCNWFMHIGFHFFYMQHMITVRVNVCVEKEKGGHKCRGREN